MVAARTAAAAAARARLPQARAAAEQVRRPLHEPRRARGRRRQHALLAPPRRPGALPARTRGAARRLRAAEHDAPRRPGGGDDRARDRRLRLDAGGGRRADAARGGAAGRPRLHEGPAEALQGRRGRVLGDGRGGGAGDRRPAARDRRDRLPLPAARHRDRRRDRARRRGRAGRRHRRGRRRTPAAILLLSDGSQTEGVLLPQEGAARAKSFKIPVYTIALGTPEGIVEFNRFGGTTDHPRPARPGDAAPDRDVDGRPLLRGGERRRPARRVRQDGVTREQGGAEAGGDVRIPRGRLVLLLAAAAVAVVTFPRLP